MLFPSCQQAWSLIISAWGNPARIESAVRRVIDTMGKHAVYPIISLDSLVAKSTWKETRLDRFRQHFE